MLTFEEAYRAVTAQEPWSQNSPLLAETVCLDFAHFVFPNLPYTVYETFQAANGDMLSLVDTGNYNVATMAFTDGVFMATGGTGRFLDAHGGGSTVLSVDSDGSGHVTEVAYTGILFYDASARSG